MPSQLILSSRSGISPPRARRTGREALASSGSHCPAAPLQKRPVSEQQWLSPRYASDPVRCLPSMASQGLEFPIRPSSQNTVDVSQGRVGQEWTPVRPHFRALFPVESGEVGFIALPPPARSNGSCSFPASRF